MRRGSIYLFAQQILCALAHLPLVVVMDASQVGRNCMVLMVGVVYKKRALPLVWLVYPGKKGHTSAERHIHLLEKLKALLPEGVEIILMGDAEYDTTEMLLWLQENSSWKYVLRTSPQTYVHIPQGEHPIADMPLWTPRNWSWHSKFLNCTSRYSVSASSANYFRV